MGLQTYQLQYWESPEIVDPITPLLEEVFQKLWEEIILERIFDLSQITELLKKHPIEHLHKDALSFAFIRTMERIIQDNLSSNADVYKKFFVETALRWWCLIE